MKAKCRTCGLYWIISTRAPIPKQGYECPVCDVKRKRASRNCSPIRLKEKYLHVNYNKLGGKIND